MYEVRSYYDSEFRGLEDSEVFDDWSDVTLWTHEHASKGGFVRIKNTETGLDMEIDPNEYIETENAPDILNGSAYILGGL